MATHPFRILNVFTQGAAPLTGNPLCVFEDGLSLGAAQMQGLARQFNLSETTFILPSTCAHARVRIFTPAYEMPFAGHPTLGTAHVCRALGLGGDALVLEMHAGLIPVKAHAGRWTLTAPTPTWRDVAEPRGAVAAALGLHADEIGERPLWIKAGKEQLVVPLNSLDALQRARPDPKALREIRSEDGISMAYVFAFHGPNQVTARFFFPQGPAVLEDPATGSATANFGGWCLSMRRPLPLSLQISQGEFVQRPSTLFLDVNADAQIFVGGEVVEIGRGTLNI